jgi:TolA-binding protein
MLQSVLILYDVAEIPRAEERILQYVNEKPDGQYARTMLSMMIRDNLIKQEVSDVIGLRDHIEGMPSTQEQDELMLQADLHYMLAFGYFQDREFALATEQFERIRDKKYSNSSNYSDALFYHGMGEMMQGKYQEAMDDFVSYRNQYKSGEHLPASMFREAVCFFGLGDTIQSEAVFTQFIGTYSDHALVSEAYSMRGDIEGAKDGNDDPSTPDVNEYDPHTLDRALADYRKGIDTASTELQASYPAFQAAKVFKLEFKWQEIIDLMNYYMNKWDDKADVAQAVYWIGQSQIEMDQVPEAITAYLDAIERFGNEVSQEGVDKIIVELVNIADQYLYEEDRAALVTKVKLKLSALDERLEVLKIRLQVALAQLEGEAAVAQLGAELLQSAANLDKTTPVSLAIMCDAAVAASDAAQMDRLFDYFVSMYEEADLLWHAYRAQVNSLLVSQDPQAVLDAIEEAQGLFGADAYMAWAQISKAQTLFDMRKYVEAEEAYNMIMGVAEWRGRVFAEAMYGMGQCRVARRDFETAHSFFQRTYLLFKGYDEGKWALMGYMAAADCLVQLGRDADAVNTWNALLEDEYVNELPAAEEARDMLKKYGGA